MSLTNKILAIIPARGGSKGIPKKNLCQLHGIPLIAHSINFANKLIENKLIDSYLVNTDDLEIATVAKSYGAPIPFMRPSELATDTATTTSVLRHCIEWFEANGKQFDYILLLQPTSPFRNIKDIQSIREIINKNKVDSIISIFQLSGLLTNVVYTLTDTRTVKPISTDHNSGARRQESKPIYVRNGCYYLTNVNYFKESGKIFSDTPNIILMEQERSINIDTIEDLERAKSYQIDKVKQ